jgi:hypothetical protein
MFKNSKILKIIGLLLQTQLFAKMQLSIVNQILSARHRCVACILHFEFIKSYYYCFDCKKAIKIICILFFTTLLLCSSILFGNVSQLKFAYIEKEYSKYTSAIDNPVDTTPDLAPNPSCSCVFKQRTINVCFDKASTPFSCRLLSAHYHGNFLLFF